MTDPAVSASRAAGRMSARVRLAAVAALLATFAAGAAAGVGVERWRHVRHRSAPSGAHDRGGAGGAPGANPMSDRFLGRLDLAPAQRAAVDSILERRRGQLEKFWAGPGHQLRSVVDSTRNEVRAVLTTAQRAAYDSMMAARRTRGREHGGPGAPGGGGAAVGPPD